VPPVAAPAAEPDRAAAAAPRPAMVLAAVAVAALGNFVDTYDLLLFSVVRIASLRDLGLTGQALTDDGLLLLNLQMLGMLLGGVLWGALGDKRGRLSVLFGSILVYSAANLANAFVHSFGAYAAWRVLAGIGLSGELGAGITLVSEILPRGRRGYGTMAVAGAGLLGGMSAVLVSRVVPWRTCYLIGGVAGLLLLALRLGVRESGMFARLRSAPSERGNFLMLFQSGARLRRYLGCVLIGLPIWYTVGILVTLAPEFGRALGVRGELAVGTAVLLTYGAGAVGDVLSAALSQRLRSRKKVLIGFLAVSALTCVVYHLSRGASTTWFVGVYLMFGLGTGFWVTMLTMAAEQFGTDIRATVATTVPNFVRALIIPVTFAFNRLRPQVGFVTASLIVGLCCYAIALWRATRLEETFGRDLDYSERDRPAAA